MNNVLFLWPPQHYFYGSLFKHFTYFGETINYVKLNTECEIRAIDAGIKLYSIKEMTEAFSWADYLVLYIEPYTIESSIKISKFAKLANEQIKIIAYGTACCYIPQFLLKNSSCDAVVKTGFWEKSIVDYINDYLPYDERGEVITNDGIMGVIKKISCNEWGHPDIELLPIDDYFSITDRRQMEICVNKGCPYPCSFCTEKYVYGNKDLRRSIDNTLAFIEKTHNSCDTYYFDSTTFTLDKTWVRELCNKIIMLPYDIKWRTVTRLDSLDEDIIALMSKAGCYKISIGIETLKQSTQNMIKKNIDIENMKKTFSVLKKYRIIPRALLIIGLPHQSEEEVQETFRCLKDLNVELRVKEYCPYNEVLTESISIDTIRSLDRTEYLKNTEYVKYGSSDYMQKMFLSKDE